MLSRLQPGLALAVGLSDKDRCKISSHHDVVSFLLETKNTTFYIYQTSLFLFYFDFFVYQIVCFSEQSILFEPAKQLTVPSRHKMNI